MNTDAAEREGADIVEENGLGTESPQSDAVRATMDELRRTQSAWSDAMKGDDALADGFRSAQQKGMGLTEAYEWMLENGYGTEESLAPLADVVNATVRAQSMYRGTQEKIEETVQDHVSTWQWEGSDFGQGELSEPVMLYVQDAKKRRLMVKSGGVRFDEKGRAVSGDMLICLDLDKNEMVHVSAKDVTFVGSEPAKDYAEKYRQKLQEANSAGYEMPEEAPVAAESPTEEGAKGLPEAGTDESGSNEAMRRMAKDGFDAEMQRGGVSLPEEQAKGLMEHNRRMAEEDRARREAYREPASVSGREPAEEPSGNYDRDAIPTDGEGEPIYEGVPKERTVEDLFGRLGDGGLAHEFATAKVAEAEKRVESLQKKAPKMGTKVNEYLRKKAEYEAAVKKAEASVNYWQGVKDDIERLTHTTPDDLEEQKRELDGTAAKESMIVEDDTPENGVALAAAILADSKVTPESLKAESGGKSIASLAENVAEMDRAYYNGRYFGGDDAAARDAVLEALGMAKTRGELRALARPNEAKAVRDYEDERDRLFYNQYGMGYEDYLDYAEQEMVHVIGNLSNFDEGKYLQEHAVGITEQIDKEHGKGIEGHESAGEEPVHGAGGEVLSGEGVDESAGGGPLAGHREGEAEVRGGHHKDAALEEEASGGGVAETQRQVDEALKTIATEITKQTGVGVVTDESAGQSALEDALATDSNVKYHKETDQGVLNELNSGETIKVYRAMQVIDGKLYPPMAASVNGKLVEDNELGTWIRADENPDLAIPDIDPKTGLQKIDKKTGELKWKFKLDKGGKDATGKKATDVNAAYNPYWHMSRSPLNDQFKSAWIRPNIVVVECEVPVSELTSGYKAERAKDAVGEVDWKSGSVSGEVFKQTGRARKVILSRWCKPVRVLDDAEVAQKAKEFVGEAKVEIPENVLTPKQRVAFEEAGFKIGVPEKGVKKSEQILEALEKGLQIDNRVRLSEKEKGDAIKRIDERIAELHRQDEEPSHNTDHGNPAEPLTDGEYSPDDSGVQGATPDAKVQKGFHKASDMAKKIAEFVYNFGKSNGVNANNFAKSFIEDKKKPTEQLSDYVHYLTEDGERITIRLSDHSGNARNIIVMGKKSDKGYSIVIRTPETETPEGTFKGNKWAKVEEYVYKNPDKARLKNIARGLFDLVDRGEYVDLAEANDYHPSPKGRKEFRGKDGEVYGFALDGKIYLNLKKMKPETPIHEYSHLWVEALKRVNPEEWENVKKLFDEVEGLKEEVQKLYPELKGDDLYEEIITTYSGRVGAKKLETEARRLASEEGKTVTESAKAQGFIGKVKEALQKYWRGVADFLHIHFTSAEEVADKVLADWAKGINPNGIEPSKDPMQGIRDAADAYREEKAAKTETENSGRGGQQGQEDVRPKQKVSQKVRSALESIAEDLGYKVVWHDTLQDNGYIDYKKKEIHIAEDAENPLDAVFGHESTHAIRKSSEAEFVKLRDAVKRLIGEDKWNELIKSKREEDYAEAKLEEEVTGDVVGSILHDRKMAEGLARELKGDPGIIAKIREIWHKIIDRLKSIGAKEELKQTEDALAAFEAVVHAFKTAKEKADEERLTPGTEMRNDNGDVIARMDDAGDIAFSHRTYKDFTDEDGNRHKGTRSGVIEHLESQEMKKADIKKFVDNMDYWYDLTGKVADLVDKDGNFLFDSFHAWSQTSPLYKRYEGNIVRAVSTLVTNGEYPLNFELSTDCIKREAFTQIINEMVNIGGTFWKKLTPEKIQELRTLQKSYGIQVACPLCFVEGKRLNIMKWATSVSVKWNEAVKRVVGDREVTPFGFGQGTFVPDAPYDERTTPQSVVDQINAVARIVGDHDGVLPADLARMQANTKAMEDKLQSYYEDFVGKHGSGNDFSLTNAQIGELRSLRGKNSKNVVGRMVSMIATHPELQHTLDVSDLVGSKGLTEIRKRGGEAFAQMYSLIISANGTGTPKVVQDAQPYSGEIIDVSQNAFDKADKIGGARLFSFSDFDITKVFDIMQIMWDCAARNARVQSYSKEIPYILIFGKSGVKINMSMLPEARPAKDLVDAYKNTKGESRKRALERIRENAGLDMDGDKIVGMQLSDSHSVSKEFAESIYRNPEYNANCGAIMVGVSANHSIYAMLQGYIRQVIPFHLSGMPISARRATDCQYYRDFTNEQNTGVIVNGRRVKAKWGENIPVKSDFNFYENESEPGWNMRQRARDYVKWCADNGLVPRFEWAVNSKAYADWCRKKGYKPNGYLMQEMDKRTTDGVFDEYYKVLTDYTAYQPVFDAEGRLVDEIPAPHKAVTGDFAVDEKTLGMTLGVDAEGMMVDSNSMLANRERTIKNTDINKKEIAQKAILLVNGKAKVDDLIKEDGSQFDNNSDSDKFMEATGEDGIDRSKRKGLDNRERNKIDREMFKSLKGEEALAEIDSMFKEKSAPKMPETIEDVSSFRHIFANPIRSIIGEMVRVKDEVFNKIVRNGRKNISGAVLPTIQDADFAIKDADGSTIYVKRFGVENKDKIYNVAVVNKYGEVEDYVSSVHIKNDNNLRNKIEKGAELLLPTNRNTYGNESQSNSTPIANLTNPPETAKVYAEKVQKEDIDRSKRKKKGDTTSVVADHIIEVNKKVGGKVRTVTGADDVTDERVKAALAAGKKVKGWYDGKTGEVCVYLPNVKDKYTAEKVVWHETVGHKGMRGLLGEEGYRNWLKGLWYDLDNPVNADLREYVKDRTDKDSLSMYDAIEEYVADAAEKGKGEPGFWNGLRNGVTAALQEAGFRVSPNVKDVQYMLWLAKNVQKHPDDPVWKMRAEAAQWKIDHREVRLSKERGGELVDNDGHVEDWDDVIDGEMDGKIHFSTSPATATEIDQYNRAVGCKTAMLKESYLDKMNSVMELMKVLIPGMERVEDVNPMMNPLMAENLMASQISARGTKFVNQEMARLTKAYNEAIDAFPGKNTEERMRTASLYMIEKHGLERNRVFYVRDYIGRMRKKGDEQGADILQRQWNAEKKDLGDKLRNGQMNLAEYYQEMDEWIRLYVKPKYKAEEHDYSGMHGLQDIDNNDPYDDAGAIADVMAAEARMEGNRTGSVHDLWKSVKDATDFAIHEEYRTGYVSKEGYERLRDMFDWYVPLRRYDEQTMEDTYSYLTGSVNASNSIGLTIKKAKGRKSLSDVNVLAQIGAMADSSMYRGGGNVMRQSFARMVNEYEKAPKKERVVTEIKGWAVKSVDANGNEVWTEAHPPIPADDTDQVSIMQAYDVWEQQMEAKAKTGDAVETTTRDNIPYKFLPESDRSQHIVSVWINGRRHDYLINGNPRAAQALNGLLRNKTSNTALAAVNRFLAQSVTSWNPEFMLRNTIRDFGFASHLLEAKEGAAYWMKFEKHFMAMGLAPAGRVITAKSLRDAKNGLFVSLFKRYEAGTLDYSKPYHKWFAEFMDTGGTTGIATTKNLDAWKKMLKGDVKKMREGMLRNPSLLWKTVFGCIEDANVMCENITRFATFCASRESGRTMARSAYDAHEVSVNFNRSGSGNAVKTYI